MIASEAEYERTKEYVAGLERTLHHMRETLTPSQYRHMSESFLKELSNAQREMLMYLAASPTPEETSPQTLANVAA
jgi:hypothetical protein